MANAIDTQKPADAGKSKLTGFRYSKGYCIATLENGIQGILGSATDCPLGVLLSLKGSKAEVSFIKAEHQMEGDAYTRYFLSWSLE